MFIQVTGVVPVPLVSDLSRIFLFKLTFKKGGKSHSNKWHFNSDKAVPVNKAKKAVLEPTLAALLSLPQSVFPSLLGSVSTNICSACGLLLPPGLGWAGLSAGQLHSSQERLLDAIKSEPAAGSWRHSILVHYCNSKE